MDKQNQALNLRFQLKEDGSVLFEDGIIYSKDELHSLRTLKKKSNNYDNMVRAIHLVKQFDCEVGLVL